MELLKLYICLFSDLPFIFKFVASTIFISGFSYLFRRSLIKILEYPISRLYSKIVSYNREIAASKELMSIEEGNSPKKKIYFFF